MLAPDSEDPDHIARIAGGLRVSLALVSRRLKQLHVAGDITIAEVSALARLEREGPSTPGALAAWDQISPQSMGATLTSLEVQGLVNRGTDPDDGRRVVVSITEAGRDTLVGGRRRRTEKVAQALAKGFTAAEREQLESVTPLLERLAQAI
ncbi:MAG: regulatory protein MarR [Frankiales bacterium]|nr:regulatory protein MarR [Frankiales bacterium]